MKAGSPSKRPQVPAHRAARHPEPQLERVGQPGGPGRSGKLGKLLCPRGLCYKPRGSIGTKPNMQPPPADFNLWWGQPAERPFHGNLAH